MTKVFIQNKEDSHLGSNIYVIYDRHFIKQERQLWLGTDFRLPIPEVLWFLSEPEAREWLITTGSKLGWMAANSLIYIIELPQEISLLILLSNDRSEKLQELLTVSVIEQLWSEQYKEIANDYSRR